MTIFVISDTHFNHHNILEYDQRPFENVIEMNEAIIKNWNRVVKEGDLVYHLGDFGMGETEYLAHIFSYLKGNITIVRGNHEGSLTKLFEIGFNSIADEVVLNYMGNILVLTHVADICIEDITGMINIHGHTHSREKFKKNFINVSCNAWDYKPIALDSLLQEYKKKETNNGF